MNQSLVRTGLRALASLVLLAGLTSAAAAEDAQTVVSLHASFKKAKKLETIAMQGLAPVVSVLNQGKGTKPWVFKKQPAWTMSCAVELLRKGKVLPPAGQLVLQIDGRDGSGAWYRSPKLIVAGFDADGTVEFTRPAVLSLLEEFPDIQPETAVLAVSFNGSFFYEKTGVKVHEVTLTCEIGGRRPVR